MEKLSCFVHDCNVKKNLQPILGIKNAREELQNSFLVLSFYK